MNREFLKRAKSYFENQELLFLDFDEESEEPYEEAQFYGLAAMLVHEKLGEDE